MTMPPVDHDLRGKLAIVTGASAGIGEEIAKGLARQGAQLVLACRNAAKAEAARARILAAVPAAALSVRLLDVSSLTSIRAFAASFLAEHPRLDILVNNAGSWSSDFKHSVDGLELTWATNVVGPELLTELLLPALQAAPQARVINLVSTVAGGLKLDDIEFKARKYDGIAAYSQAKQAERMMTWALAERLQGSAVTANATSPGLVRTDLNRDAKGFMKFVFSLLVPLMGKTPAQGADTPLWLASAPELAGVSGKFWEDRQEKPCKFREDKAAIQRLGQAYAKSAAV